MTDIEVRDQATGLSLAVRENVWADTNAGPLPLPIATEYEAIAMARFGQSLDAELAAFRADIEAAERRWGERYGIHDIEPEPAPEPEHTWADLPPAPELQLAPDALEAEAQARAAVAERRHRQEVLAEVGQREQTEPFVPEVPQPSRWARLKAGVVLYLEQRKAEKEMT